jgi:hypothetical protein
MRLAVQACLYYYVGAMPKSIQYTVRGVSQRTDSVLREMAAEEGVSLNTVALSLLDAAADQGAESPRVHDLDSLSGSWVTDPAFDDAVKAFDQIDPSFWR